MPTSARRAGAERATIDLAEAVDLIDRERDLVAAAPDEARARGGAAIRGREGPWRDGRRGSLPPRTIARQRARPPCGIAERPSSFTAAPLPPRPPGNSRADAEEDSGLKPLRSLDARLRNGRPLEEIACSSGVQSLMPSLRKNARSRKARAVRVELVGRAVGAPGGLRLHGGERAPSVTNERRQSSRRRGAALAARTMLRGDVRSNRIAQRASSPAAAGSLGRPPPARAPRRRRAEPRARAALVRARAEAQPRRLGA